MGVLNWVNRFLARTIAALNAALAILIVALSALSTGSLLASLLGDSAAASIAFFFLGSILGIGVGAVFALIFCGLIALMVDIRQVLIEIRDKP